MSPCWIWSNYNERALRARWLFYHFISNSGSWNNCYILVWERALSSQKGAKKEDPFSLGQFTLNQFPIGPSSRGQTLPPDICTLPPEARYKANSIFTFRPCRCLFLCFCSDTESFVYGTLIDHSIHVKVVGFVVVRVRVFSVLKSPTSFPLGCVWQRTAKTGARQTVCTFWPGRTHL